MTIRNQEQVFEDIYRQERWGKGKGSGTGSDPKYCEKYLSYLSTILNEDKTFEINSVFDVGCGDWQLYEGFKWPEDIAYVGCDISQTAIDIARTKTRCVIKINTIDETLDAIRIYPNDLILIKDVMQHWTDDEIEYFLKCLKRIKNWKYVLISNNWKFHRDPTKNGQPRLMDKYSWAPIPVDHPALVEFGFKPIFRYPKGGFKQVMLATRGEV